MEERMMASFLDELQKIAAANVFAQATPARPVGTTPPPSTGIPKLTPNKPTAKPTNYSIVNSQAPAAAHGAASMTSKSVPPPPVRT